MVLNILLNSIQALLGGGGGGVGLSGTDDSSRLPGPGSGLGGVCLGGGSLGSGGLLVGSFAMIYSYL